MYIEIDQCPLQSRHISHVERKAGTCNLGPPLIIDPTLLLRQLPVGFSPGFIQSLSPLFIYLILLRGLTYRIGWLLVIYYLIHLRLSSHHLILIVLLYLFYFIISITLFCFYLIFFLSYNT